MQTITLLGATGSIGLSTLDVIARHPDRFRVFALTAHKNIDALVELARQHRPEYLVVADKSNYAEVQEKARALGVTAEILAGEQALMEVSSDSRVTTVMAAIVGAAGLRPTLSAVQAGKRVLLANKEALVMSGQLFIDAVNQSGAELLPVDSEHNAIFQCLPEQFQYGQPETSGIERILLTGSGGPFLTTPVEALEAVTPEQACAHPNWSMGRKISVDSATMMNKGLEFIEACWLFGLEPEQIQVVLHPQSVIHSMVQYRDGSVIAQMGQPDMRTPIAHCLAYPERIQAGVEPLNFAALTDFSFTTPDTQRYPNLMLAIDACCAGQSATTALNAANEVAVEGFLQRRIGFTTIALLNRRVLESIQPQELYAIDDIIAWDRECRQLAQQYLESLEQA
ncbi:1-deoxy-D-xylulose-5-phosphate reductoisomerase [Saliniradius amylolyticus]|uniref:1-deoxy-D-xylulose 5-phosphate reductoisomerase n=1 Tax=Saliniradius amylolyticus TaxID=2183582 RepID=A0A2S2E4M5_9ALTE|nr:1-deoxy-D-xylulose-5-phosphate reductoisomerase [Saliniradius amylolyticus]AWL12606.1 1-deoxy-D-xylulose-5-phosphate reductoisomerase [Saliniradius amylolyticus]